MLLSPAAESGKGRLPDGRSVALWALGFLKGRGIVWFGLRGLGENSEPGPALTLTQGQAPGVGFLPQNLPAMVLMCGANLYGGREWGNRLQEQVLSGKTKWIHWKGQEHALL